VIGRLTGASDVPLHAADAVVAQTQRAYDVFQGVLNDPRKLHIVSGFIPTERLRTTVDESSVRRWLFVGRLTREKGLKELLKIWPRHEYLDVIGDGPERPELEAIASDTVTFLGEQPRDQVREMMRQYRGLVFPGVAWEGAHPLVLREAWASGLPVVAAEGSSAASVISAWGGGSTFALDNESSLREALHEVALNAGLRDEALALASTRFSEALWIGRMDAVFDEAIVSRDSS